jgi:crotonobetaine/carnitine-CoA ligase
MGMPPDGITAEIMDDDGNLVGPDEPGELVFHVKEEELQQRSVVYYKDEAASQSRIEKGKDGRLWFHTGDLATKDETGWFYFVDRKKDAIRRRGENIAAWSVERVVNQHDKVLESAAYGVKSAEYGEDEVMVAVVMRPGESITPEELLDFCRDKMADFMIPRFIDFVEKLPKSEVHRIMKRFLKDRGATETTYDREKAGYSIKKA